MAKKLSERIREELEKNKQASEKLRQDANNKFNEYASKSSSKSNNMTLWDKIQNIAGNTGRIGQNTYLGAKVGVKDMTNYMYETANSSLNSKMPLKEKQEKMNRVKTSKELTQKEKDTYLMIENAKQKSSRMPINNNSEFKPLLPIKQTENIDYEKIEAVANKNAYLDSIKEDEKKIQENIEKQDGVVSKKLAELAPSVGNMGVGAVASAVNPVAGATYFGMSAGGSYMRDGLDRGMSKEEAINYGTIMGIMEGATEAVGVGMFSKAGKTLKTVVKGAGKEVVKEGAEQVGKASIKQALKQYGIGIADNIMQESLIEPIQEITAGVIGGKDKADWSNMGSRMLQAGINGGLTGAIVGGANLGLSSCAGVIEKARNGQQVTQEEIQTAVKDASQKLDVQKMIVDSTQQQVNKYKNNIQNLQQTNNNQENLANNQETLYNNITLGETKNVPIEEILPLQTSGGYRTQSEMANLKEDIAKNGIQNPIELAKRNDGTIEIENGNHRLMIAKELGLKEVPIKFVEGWENVGKNVDKTESKFVENWEKSYDRNNGNGATINKYNVGDGIIEGDGANNRNEFENGTTTERNDSIPNEIQTYNDRPSSSATSEQSTKGLEQSSPFSMQDNIGRALTKEQQEYFKDSKVRDDKGNLLTVYHGTDSEFSEYANIKTEPGYWFTENKEYASEHGKNIKEQYLNLINPIDDIDTMWDLAKSYFGTNITEKNILSNEFKEHLKSLGYDGMVWEHSGSNTYVAFDSNQIKNTDNTRSTTNPDIRYSLPTKKQTTPPQRQDTESNNIDNNNIHKKTRKEVQQNLLQDTGLLNESLDNAKNLNMLNINRTDPIRLQEKVFGKELGTKINDMFFGKVKHNTARKIRFLNLERNSIKDWGIKARSKESEILQKYTEKTYVNNEGKEIAYTENDLNRDIKDKNIRDKIKNASKQLREKYDQYIDSANTVLTDLGYDPIPKRKDYVRHFTELNDIFSKFGIPGKLQEALPTDINGITDQFRPGKNFFANAQRRYGNKTTYDAITGIDGYLEGIGNLIYHTEDIQRLRALDSHIRNTYGQNGFENLENLSEEERVKRIENIQSNHLSNYVSWLTEYTNSLAGKKSGIDRSVEKLLGRNIYSALDTIKKQTGSNMTGLNIGSALTNFISITQGASKTNKLSLLKGTADTIKNIFHNDNFVDKSDFLTNRFGSDRISNNLWQKASNVGQIFMNATDYFSSNVIVRSKYYENIAKGMDEQQAIKQADDFGARILGDRSQGATANIFNSKMLGILTQFQLEVNNQMDTMIHDTKQDFTNITESSNIMKASMGAVWILGQMAVFQHVFNNLFESIAGRRPAFDIIDIIKTAFGLDDEEKEDTSKNIQQASIKLVESLPFLNLLSEDSRIPIASAVPNPISIATGESSIKDEVSKLTYLLPPTGGSQIKKSIEGLKTVDNKGSYVTNSKGEKELRFPVENPTTKDYIKAVTLGKYALPLAREYVNRDYKRLSAKQTKTYEDSKLPYKEYIQYLDAGLKKTQDKINYLENKEMSTEQKWGIYKNDIFSNDERDDGGSQLKDAEYITSNGVSKEKYIELYNNAKKNNIDMPTKDEYKELQENSITLDKYIDYKINVKRATTKKQEEEKDENAKLDNKEQIQVLIESNYSKQDKSALYEKYIKSKEDSNYDVMKVAGIDIDEILKYKQQDFKSDKKDDGTLQGKTVNKSKQKKVVNYLNSMRITGNQRLLLYAMNEYTTTSNQKNQLAKYVYDLDLKQKEKLELYSKFQGFTVYKNGTVKW